MAHADARAAGAGLVARPARQPGIAGRLHGLGPAWRYGVVSLPALRLEAGGWRLEAGQRSALLSASDRKSTRLNSSHVKISYADFCLEKKIILKNILPMLSLW